MATESCSGSPTKPSTGSRVPTRTKQHITPTLTHLHWLLVKYHIIYKLLLLVYKSLHNLAPQYLLDLLHQHTPSVNLRSSDSGLLSVPSTKTFGDRAFSVAAPTLCNSLPTDTHHATSLDTFKSALKDTASLLFLS
ncbi:uncharacterized protein AKAME5_000920900 [Lates japonicus]|uniref:Uncharacterized protein n=1 Tax=Lates japonicus TaxID=270547 RepID=A0AAD3R4E9_LATJO|nr:uncharacterized protein AKAME5_000920900 [Lates japonicus]